MNVLQTYSTDLHSLDHTPMRSLHIRMPLDFAIDGFSGKRDIHVTGPVQRLDDLGQRRFRDAGGYELAGVNLGCWRALRRRTCSGALLRWHDCEEGGQTEDAKQRGSLGGT